MQLLCLWLCMSALHWTGTRVEAEPQQLSARSGECRYRHAAAEAHKATELLLGALVSVHDATPQGQCGRLKRTGVYSVEALHLSLDTVNERLLHCCGLVLGALTFDTCTSSRVGLQNALHFVNHGMGSVEADDVIGIIGPSANNVAEQLANLFTLVRLPQISFMSTSAKLSDPDKYPYFLRTVPSEKHHASALAVLLQLVMLCAVGPTTAAPCDRELNWTYVLAVYDASKFGLSAQQQFSKAVKNSPVCVGEYWRVGASTLQQHDSGDFRRELRRLADTHPKATVMVMFVSIGVAERVLRAAMAEGLEAHFTWIGTDAWGTTYMHNDLYPAASGSFLVSNEHIHWAEFETSLLERQPGSSRSTQSNPWFDEFWQQATEQGNLTLAEAVHSWELGFTHYVFEAVSAYAEALRSIHKRLCTDQPGEYCPRMRSKMQEARLSHYVDASTLLIDELHNVTYRGVDGSPHRFESGQDGAAVYSVLYYEEQPENVSARLNWQNVATVAVYSGTKSIKWLDPDVEAAVKLSTTNSSCSDACQVGEVKRFTSSTCCWTCERCSYKQMQVNHTHCKPCPSHFGDTQPLLFTRSNSWRNQCVPFEPEAIGISDPLLAPVAALSVLGCLAALGTTAAFVRYNATPVIKATGRELQIVLLVGIGVSYGCVFLLLLPPSAVVCAAVRFVYGAGYTVCYSAIFIKTNRIVRIFHMTQRLDVKLRRTRLVSPVSQLAIVAVINACQAILTLVWVLLREPRVEYRLLHDSHTQTVSALKFCESFEDYDMLIALSFPFVLLLLSACYAFKARKMPGQFNETRFVLIAVCTTVIVWLAFVPTFVTSSDMRIRVFCLAAALALNASVTLLCMFGPKLYIVLCRPHKNTKDTVMGKPSGRHTNNLRSSKCPDDSRSRSHSRTNPFRDGGSSCCEDESPVDGAHAQPLHERNTGEREALLTAMQHQPPVHTTRHAATQTHCTRRRRSL